MGNLTPTGVKRKGESEMLLCVLLFILTDLIIAEYQVTSLTSLCRKFSSSWSGVYSLSVISLSGSEEAIIVRLDQAEITAPLSCDIHIRSSRPGQSFISRLQFDSSKIF